MTAVPGEPMSPARTITDEELLQLPEDGQRYEVVDGELVDSPRRILDRVGEYLEAGVRLVWLIDPERERAVVYRALSDVEPVLADGLLDGGEVLPGFRCLLSDLLD